MVGCGQVHRCVDRDVDGRSVEGGVIGLGVALTSSDRLGSLLSPLQIASEVLRIDLRARELRHGGIGSHKKRER